jgi:hypothetical protein
VFLRASVVIAGAGVSHLALKLDGPMSVGNDSTGSHSEKAFRIRAVKIGEAVAVENQIVGRV